MSGAKSEGGGCVVGAGRDFVWLLARAGKEGVRLVGQRGTVVGSDLRGFSSCGRRKW